LLPFPSLGRSRLQSTPSPVAWSSIAAFPINLHRICVEGLVRPAFHSSTFMEFLCLWVPEVTLRLPVFPDGRFLPRCRRCSFLPNWSPLLRAGNSCDRH